MVSPEASRVEEMRQVDGGLGRRARRQAPQSIPEQKRGRRLPAADARGNRVKKSSRPRAAIEAAAAWAEARQNQSNAQAVAKEITAILRSGKPLTTDAIEKAIASWKTTLAWSTAFTRRRLTIGLLRTLARKRLLEHHVHEEITRMRAPLPRKVIASDAEVIALKRAAVPWMRAFICLCIDHAMRFSEAVNAEIANYDREKRTLRFITKGHQLHTLPVSEELRLIIDTAPGWYEPNDTILLVLAGKQIGPFRVRVEWKKLKTKANVNPALRPHDLRRTLATRIYQHTKDIRLVQQALGHHNLQATLCYLAPDTTDELRPVMDAVTEQFRWRQ